MTKFCLGSLFTLAVWIGIGAGAVGCNAQSLADPSPKTKPPLDGSSGGSFDGALDRSRIDVTEIDPCPCQLGDDGVLRMSWQCFQTQYAAGQSELGWCGAPGGWTSSCGLSVFTTDRGSGSKYVYVYDATGNPVGALLSNGQVAYVCRSDYRLTSYVIAAGQFPDATCASVPCTCNADRTFTCPGADGGASPVFDAGSVVFPAASQ